MMECMEQNGTSRDQAAEQPRAPNRQENAFAAENQKDGYSGHVTKDQEVYQH